MRVFASTIAFCSMTSKSSKLRRDCCVSFPAKKLSNGTRWDIAFPLDAETRRMIEQAVLAEYEKVVAGSKPMSNARSLS
jgi:DNA-binding cell septation regulator SpoVG